MDGETNVGTTLVELQRMCFEMAKKSGWAEKPVPVPEQVALIHSEASEALEAFRESQPMSWTDESGKPQGIGSEYADIVIRVAHYCTLNGISLQYEVDRKLAYNATRPYRHGGKVI